MSIKMFVGNLPHDMTEDKLQAIFSEACHVVSAKIVKDRYTGQPRGFGFVEMETKLEGQKAISMINGRSVGGSTLAVNEARPPQRGFGNRGGAVAVIVASSGTLLISQSRETDLR